MYGSWLLPSAFMYVSNYYFFNSNEIRVWISLLEMSGICVINVKYYNIYVVLILWPAGCVELLQRIAS